MPPRTTTHLSDKRAWRSLAEYAASPDFRAWLEREFPRQAAVWDGTLSRRQFLKLAAASLALAGLGACGVPPREQIVPYVRPPDPSVPGRPLFFATAMPLGGYGLGLLVESHEGRPTKVEGNPNHPASLGATDVFAQAAVLDLYDPARNQAPRRLGRVRPWEEFWQELAIRLEAHAARGGAGLRVLTETVSSPTLAGGLGGWLEGLPNAVWHQYEPLNRDNARAGALLAFGRDVEAVYQLERAEVSLTLDADVLTSGPAAVRYAHDFASRRRPESGSMNRLYAVESTLTPTGALADHRLPLRASEVEPLAWALTASLGAALPQAVPRPWFNALVRDLDSHRGASLVIPGEGQPPSVHALAHSLNAALGNAGQTVRYIEPVAAEPTAQSASLQALVEAMEAGEVETLLILGGNPAYTAPADLGFAQHLADIGLSVHLGLYPNETSGLTHWQLPETHFLEAWSDVRAFDGTASLIQPLLAPLYASLTPHELIARLAGVAEASAYELVRATWQRGAEGEDFEQFWRTALHDGVIAGTARPTLEVAAAGPARWGAAGPAPAQTELELVFRADPSLYDGRFAHNAWLQELPRPITTLTWDNAALLSPATAAQLGVANEDVVELTYRGRSVRAPVWVVPGHAPGSISLSLGYGQAPTEPDSERMGSNAYAVRPSDAPWGGTGLRVAKTGERYALATTQHHHLVEGRDLLRMGTLQQYNDEPEVAHAGEAERSSLYPAPEYAGERWGMVIDLSVCTGCSACVVACQSENNVPVVGKEQVLRGREMHWLRVDSYFFGEPEAPTVGFQPVPCMHCEQAPCEPVCPVGATVHSSDGLNEMVYNRCVGTRYCSNNCPYKVRRFNFLEFNDLEATPSLKLRQNPDVTVRTRGVMEKCTYCVQRIRSAQGSARAEGRAVADGEVVTACQGACPTQAIVFGDLNDPQGRAAQLRAQPRNYAMLAELNTQPRTTYLAAVRNVNTEIA